MALDEIVLDELAQCFRLRSLNHASEDDDTVWDEYSVTLIMKKVVPTSPGYRRSIAILHCFFHTFLRGLALLDLAVRRPAFKI